MYEKTISQFITQNNTPAIFEKVNYQKFKKEKLSKEERLLINYFDLSLYTNDELNLKKE